MDRIWDMIDQYDVWPADKLDDVCCLSLSCCSKQQSRLLLWCELPHCDLFFHVPKNRNCARHKRRGTRNISGIKKKRCGAKKHQYLAKQFKKKEKTRPDETRLLHSVACVFLTVRGSFWLHVFLFALSPVVLIYPSLVWVTEVVRWGLGHQEPSTKKQISLLLKSPKTLQRSLKRYRSILSQAVSLPLSVRRGIPDMFIEKNEVS